MLQKGNTYEFEIALYRYFFLKEPDIYEAEDADDKDVFNMLQESRIKALDKILDSLNEYLHKLINNTYENCFKIEKAFLREGPGHTFYIASNDEDNAFWNEPWDFVVIVFTMIENKEEDLISNKIYELLKPFKTERYYLGDVNSYSYDFDDLVSENEYKITSYLL